MEEYTDLVIEISRCFIFSLTVRTKFLLIRNMPLCLNMLHNIMKNLLIFLINKVLREQYIIFALNAFRKTTL